MAESILFRGRRLKGRGGGGITNDLLFELVNAPAAATAYATITTSPVIGYSGDDCARCCPTAKERPSRRGDAGA